MNLAKLRGLRAEHGYTQEEVAKVLGISKVSYGLKEVGKRDFSATEVSKLCKIFNVKSSIFFDN